jgi:glycosyltransferase involved in cell wall biosynthesis
VVLMENPLISVLIDTYNYGKYVEEAIESVLTQDFPAEEMEVLVVDDGSTDDTAERVRKYGERVKHFYKKNGGQASAFNYGIARARGEYVALLDADDYWLPGKLKRVAEAFEQNPEAGLVYHAFREFVEETGEWREGSFSAVSGRLLGDRKRILQYTATQTSGLTFRTNAVRELLPQNEAITTQADGLLAALIVFLAPVVAIAEPLAVYRIHGKNLYYHGPEGVDEERQKRRVRISRVELTEMDAWLERKGFDLLEPSTLAFRKRWKLVLERDEFVLEKPGRLRFFWHLVRSMSTMNPCLNWKIQLGNAFDAAGSLLVGYDGRGKLEGWRMGLQRSLFGRGAATLGR